MFTQSQIAIICSAPIFNLSFIKNRIANYSVLIAVDGGVNHCHAMNLEPDLILGDLDSADPSSLAQFPQVPIKKYPRDKDQTDLELALRLAFHPNVEEIAIFGALGGRTDQTVGNLVLLSRYHGKIFIESESERLFVIKDQAEIATQPGQVISLIPLNGPVFGITTSGLKWTLKNGKLDRDFIGISNEALGSKVSISVQQGDLLCIINNIFT